MPEEAKAAARAAQMLATIARRVGASLALDETLDAVAHAVVETLGFRAAVVNLLGPDDELHVVAVAGSDEIRTALSGTHSPRSAWEEVLQLATPWGGLRFLHHDVGLPQGMHVFVPDLPVPADVAGHELWHPEDSLFAPLLNSHGEILGVLSVDDPEDGLRPDGVRRSLLEAFAVQAALAIEHAREHKALLESEHLLRRMFDESPIGKGLVDADGRFQRVNRAYCDFLGRSPEEFLGHRVVDLAHPDERESTARMFDEICAGSARLVKIEKRYLHADGRTMWGRLSLTRIGEGERMSVLSAIEDITEARLAEEQLRHLALHDALTGLPNRTLILDRLAGALVRSQRDGSQVGIAVVDVDHFKLVNDTHGHPVGDQLLVDLATRLRSVLRSADSVGRLGGDEFLVVCDGLASPDEITVIAERLRLAARVGLDIGGAPLVVSASVGCTTGGAPASPEQLVVEADAALYRAKTAGRGGYMLFDEDMRSCSAARLALHGELADAVRREEFRVHYQPIVDQCTGLVEGYEALLRWEHPERGLLLPGDFLDILADSDLDAPVARWVLRRACTDIAAKQDGCDYFVSVNLSARQMSRREIADDVAVALAASGLPSDRLWLEITEEHVVGAYQREVVESLRALGCRIALDDFGTGYSGLTYLQQLPVDVLKIDRQFVARVAVDRVSAGITRAVADLAQLLGIRVVAEGVETAEQAELVLSMGIPLAQGYFFGRPAPIEMATRVRLPSQR